MPIISWGQNKFLHSQSLKIEYENKAKTRKQWRNCILCIVFLLLCFVLGSGGDWPTWLWDLGYSGDFRFYANNISLKILWEIKSIFVSFRFFFWGGTTNTYKLDESLTDGEGTKKERTVENHERKKRRKTRKNNWTHFTQLLFLPLLLYFVEKKDVPCPVVASGNYYLYFVVCAPISIYFFNIATFW